MGRFFSALVKTLLILVLVLAAGWYALGEGGPFEEKGQQLFGAFQEQNSDLEQSVQDSSDEDTVLTVEEAGIDPTSAVEPSPAPEDLTTKIVFTGDVELSEYVQSNYSSAGVDGVVAPEIKDLMTNATFTMINNEFCFSERGQKAPDKQYTFRVNPSYVSLLNDLGVDIAGLANNHVLDFGRDALTDTFTTLTNAGIDYTGAGNSLDDASKLIVKTDAKGRTYGFLAASHVIPVGSWNVLNAQPGEFCFYDETDLLNAIKAADSQVDYLFVMVHWGVEHTTELTSYQPNDGHKFIDAGADAVIGMHSHCLQPVEMYNGKPIFYSLGNFIFNQNIKSGGGGAVEFAIDENDNVSYRIIPITASGACTRVDAAGFSYVESISHGVAVDGSGYITVK
ncbi:poly-gamma-glutamate synthesis protein (capsule biosynthesis protein) [Pseudobutyrivibrio sp. 49]|uniref:CapA family protein n=1 Tax=unclassified Pseudobutyrivibrio TaxID=2638619 RepID=UPI00088B7078|nr:MULTISPECIES: CapA family protein [unclassified Pseudobutyrivibrio]SDH98776.1 poly-gamma-glutamate synthesis protein (capsule biosynthesis protein) [Pseudobutyrivibrio sp. 49]SFN88426.1 poly-gamma-glutamate synthesis protein (capsule biosynthesis protein) [Pseudobutyrivibrio sp. UC1225]